jgi:hypothetical protein
MCRGQLELFRLGKVVTRMLDPTEILAIVPQLIALVPDVREIKILNDGKGWTIYCDVAGKNFQATDAVTFHKFLNRLQELIPAPA